MKILPIHLTAGLVLLFSLVCGTAQATTNEQALKAYRQGDFATAITIWRDLAKQGNANAQYRLGTMYLHGNGIKSNTDTALQWFEKAAQQGHVKAALDLGVELGFSQQRWGEARPWLEKAAAQGSAEAMSLLGSLYRNGQGVQQDLGKAAEWFDRAIRKGHSDTVDRLLALVDEGNAEAQYRLGMLFLDGVDNIIGQNIDEALKWIDKAKQQGYLVPDKDLKRAFKVIFSNLEKRAKQGDTDAQLEIGYFYLVKQDFVEQNISKAIMWLRRAAQPNKPGERGNAEAQHTLGVFYITGHDGIVEPNLAEGIKWLQLAAQQNYPSSWRNLHDALALAEKQSKNTGAAAPLQHDTNARAINAMAAGLSSMPPGTIIRLRKDIMLDRSEAGQLIDLGALKTPGELTVSSCAFRTGSTATTERLTAGTEWRVKKVVTNFSFGFISEVHLDGPMHNELYLTNIIAEVVIGELIGHLCGNSLDVILPAVK